jgi:hypothetical protein
VSWEGGSEACGRSAPLHDPYSPKEGEFLLLGRVRRNGTSMITLILPPKSQVRHGGG